MIKKISVVIVLLFSLTTMCYAKNYEIPFNCEEQGKTIKIKNIKNEEICDVSFKIINIDDDTGKVKVDVSIENVGEKDLVLFDKDNEEKELKNLVLNKKLRFDDSYSGSKKVNGSGTTKCVHYIETGGREQIMSLDLEEGDNVNEIKLYIYPIEHKIKKFLFWKIHKYNIVNEESNTFNVNVEELMNIDSIVESIGTVCYDIINEIEYKTFCNNPQHNPKLEQEKEKYQRKIEKLKEQLDTVINNGNYNKKTKDFIDALKVYMNVDLDSIMQKEDCGQHDGNRKAKKKSVKKGHSCNYCNLSLKEIRKDLELLQTGSYVKVKTEEEKSQDKKKVKTMYNCAKSRNDWKEGDPICEEIKSIYKNIM